MTKDEFFTRAITKFENNQIDALFCYIQNDRQLMKNYLDIVAHEGSLRDVNKYIAKQTATRYNTKAKEHGHKPNSTLIQSYSTLED